jgi:hypothetical protein
MSHPYPLPKLDKVIALRDAVEKLIADVYAVTSSQGRGRSGAAREFAAPCSQDDGLGAATRQGGEAAGQSGGRGRPEGRSEPRESRLNACP